MQTAHQILAAELLHQATESGTYFGDRKVFLGTIPGIDLADPECVLQLIELMQAGLIRLARADLVAAMDPALVACSTLDGHGFTAHFLVVV